MDLWEALAVWFTIIGGIWILFKAMEETTNLATKKEVASRLKNVATRSASETILECPQYFTEAFDRIFGKRHFTPRCFLISSIASTIAALILILIWGFSGIWMNSERFASYENISEIIFTKNFIMLTIIGILMLNIIPDYISLLETRWILNMATHTNMKRLIAVLILDILITGAIYFGVSGAILCINNELSGGTMTNYGTSDSVGSFWGTYYHLYIKECFFMAEQPGFWMGPIDPLGEKFLPVTQYIRPPGARPPLYILFLSTYFTSIWIYLFAISDIAAKIAYSTGIIGNKFMSLLNIAEKPFQSMGILAMVSLTIMSIFYEIISIIINIL